MVTHIIENYKYDGHKHATRERSRCILHATFKNYQQRGLLHFRFKYLPAHAAGSENPSILNISAERKLKIGKIADDKREKQKHYSNSDIGESDDGASPL